MYDVDPGSRTFSTLLRTLRNLNPGAGRFGQALAASENRAVIGADADGLTVANSGTAFVVDVDPASPNFGTVRATLKKPGAANGDLFGAVAAFLGDDILVGAANHAGTGALYKFAASGFLTLPASISENGTLALSGAFADAGRGDTHTVIIDWGDGGALSRIPLAAGVFTFSASRVYLDDNPTGTASDAVSIRVRVIDDATDVLVFDAGAHTVGRYEGATNLFRNVLATIGVNASGLAVGPTGDLFVSLNAAGNTAVQRYSGATGLLVGTFVAAGSEGVTVAGNLAFRPDGNLCRIDSGAGRVLRYDGRTGAFLGVVVAQGSGGLTTPRDLAFGPDGSLYLASAAGNVPRYRAGDGVFLGEFLPAVTVGLAQLGGLAFAADGTLLLSGVTPAGDNVVLRFDGSTGDALGELVRTSLPLGTSRLLIASNGALYVADAGSGQGVEGYVLETGEFLGRFAPSAAGPIAALSPMDEFLTTATITNVTPTVTVRAQPNAIANQYTLGAVVTDPGTLDTFTYAWSITTGIGGGGVGATNGSSFTFTTAGASTVVTLTVTDDDTGASTVKTQIVIGTGNPDTISLANANFTLNGVNTPYGSGISKVVVYALAGNDLVNASTVTSFPVELIGGLGNDSLVGGSQGDLLLGNSPGDYALGYGGDTGNDSLTGNAGNDTLDGGLGNDVMIGGAGDDRFVGSLAEDIFLGASPSDEVGPLVLKPATVVLEWNNATYDGQSHAAIATATGSNGELLPLTVSYYAGAMATGAPLVGAPVGVGIYTVLAAFAGNTNYSAASATATITISPAPLTITAASASRPYGAANPPLNVSYQGFVPGEGPSVLSGSLSVTTEATLVSPVAAYATTASGVSSPNYAINFVPGTLDVTPAVLTVSAQNQDRVYGDANPGFTAVFSGFQNSETLATSGVQGVPSLTTAAYVTSPVGTYTINAARGTLTAGNYSFAFGSGTLTVTQAPLTVSPNNASTVYGAALPPFTGTIVGLKNNDNLGVGYGTSAQPLSDVGTYSITVSFGDPGGRLANYVVTPSTSTLTVEQAPQSITWANPASIVFGTPLSNAQLNAIVSGVASGTGPGALTYSVATGAVLYAGTYTLSVSAAATSNYLSATATVSLSVTQATPTVNVTWDNATYDGLSHPALGSITGVGGAQLGTPTFT